MSYLIAVTGKGGVGKTTVAALLIHSLIKRGCTPVLAVDADPNTCLDAALGVSVDKTVGAIREEARAEAGKGMGAGISKQELLEIKIARCLVEARHFDLIAMGRPEGPGCYCYANNVLKSVLAEISSQYPYVVLDNEAGLENLSRRIVQKVELLVITADSSRRGLDTVFRLFDLAKEMEIGYDRLAIMINRLRQHDLPVQVIYELEERTHAEFVLGLPEDEQLLTLAEQGRPLLELTQDNPVLGQLDTFIHRLFLK